MNTVTVEFVKNPCYRTLLYIDKVKVMTKLQITIFPCNEMNTLLFSPPITSKTLCLHITNYCYGRG